MLANIIKLFFLLAAVLLSKAQNNEDTLVKWKAKFATLTGIPKVSATGNWISISKSYTSSVDSTFVINTRKDKNEIYSILNSNPTFLNDEGILGHIGSKAEFLNLRSGRSIKYENVLKTYVLEKHGKYALLKNDNHLLVYNHKGEQLLDVTEVESTPVKNSIDKLYFIKKNVTGCDIFETMGEWKKLIYSTINQIQKIELTLTGKQLIITEVVEDNNKNKLIVLDTDNANKVLLELNIAKQAVINFIEIQNGCGYLICERVRSREEKGGLVDIWYGNDPYLNEHYKMFQTRNFWFWKPKDGALNKLLVPENFEVNSLNNARYFLTYLPRKDYNYITSEPALKDAQIYDLQLNVRTVLGNLELIKRSTKEWDKVLDHNIYASPDGKRFLATIDGMQWSLYHANGNRESIIEKTGLEQPVYSRKGDFIYFESSDGLWKYNIKLKRLTSLNIGRGDITKIKNYTVKNDNFTATPALKNEKLLIEVYNKSDNVVAYQLLYKDKLKQLVPQTKNRISPNNLIYNTAMTSFFALEENYHMPPALYAYQTGEERRLLFDGKIKDEGVKKIKQDIVSYKAAGKDLKGVLFFPTKFDPQKMYPMVVRIYDRQRYISNGYLSPNKVMPEGFQIRTLLERGYFVYLPDIAVGEHGAGLSALECVNNALDAVLKNPNIDTDKIGLCGQSYGGYETNFIATHSNRFATYISGSAISDVIGNYYSYNYSFNKPNYFLYESTIYRMRKSIAFDKEKYLKNNPILYVEKMNAPILLWAGKKDNNVPYDQSMEFFIALKRYKKDVVALFYKNGDHSFPSGTSEEIDLSTKVLDWWDYFLQDKRKISWINKQMRKDAY